MKDTLLEEVMSKKDARGTFVDFIREYLGGVSGLFLIVVGEVLSNVPKIFGEEEIKKICHDKNFDFNEEQKKFCMWVSTQYAFEIFKPMIFDIIRAAYAYLDTGENGGKEDVVSTN